MEKVRKLYASLILVLVCFFTFFNGYNSIVEGNFAYADTTTDNWQNVTTNEELAEAFRYYCKSRDLTIEGSIADGVTSFTTMTFNNLCNGLGIDMTALQAHLKKETDGSNVRYLFDSTGITAYNNIFGQFLQDNELSVGDTVNDEELYDGQLYDDGENKCLIWVLSGALTSTASPQSNLLQKGSSYKYSTSQLIALNGSNAQFHLNNYYYNKSVTSSNSNVNGDVYTVYNLGSYPFSGETAYRNSGNVYVTKCVNGSSCIVQYTFNSKYYLATFTHYILVNYSLHIYQ